MIRPLGLFVKYESCPNFGALSGNSFAAIRPSNSSRAQIH